MKYLTKEALVEGLKSEEPAAFEQVYQEAYRLVEYYIKSNGGDKIATQDIFQDGIIALVELARKPEFALTAKVSNLMYSICRNIWLKSFRKKGKEVYVEQFHPSAELVEIPNFGEEESEDEAYQEVVKTIEQIGEKCKEIILLAHYQGVPRDEIAEIMGYSSAFARIKLFRCMNRLREQLGITI